MDANITGREPTIILLAEELTAICFVTKCILMTNKSLDPKTNLQENQRKEGCVKS